MMIGGIRIAAQEGITEQEIRDILHEEKALWQAKGRRLGEVSLTLDGDEIIVKATERSPIKRIRRITGYLSTSDRFNDAKQAELSQRIAHS
ncbi:MAG TPA: anaerobic ribonucleoside-triphosphate reductase [Methylomusa anaerophila]|uniref:Anaerobic ribonucleoside triphosphate reductase n=1 Tax=Methylomusa anaerophila TaxID=1930071 RepID=A0A348AJ76_9FIRM|nr:anaerobic ribonucleoside-triphosphate reductase [Methylomusa anaerophila]BBB91124.1 anaerobic ribonucleoside triphosphate reductase [Methylomusa anaerophila]HML89001.1 anaerobic ribonucleoside-triphosphate reductase [Methylomusa anaerophila]